MDSIASFARQATSAANASDHTVNIPLTRQPSPNPYRDGPTVEGGSAGRQENHGGHGGGEGVDRQGQGTGEDDDDDDDAD
ncbi:hypothetical protein PG990_004266 [Apiospora arundinis]